MSDGSTRYRVVGSGGPFYASPGEAREVHRKWLRKSATVAKR